MLTILKDIIRFIFSANSTSAACLAIGLGSWLEDEDVKMLGEYYKSLHCSRLERKVLWVVDLDAKEEKDEI
jgi:hypothetical protein